jgi:hypothetical protein
LPAALSFRHDVTEVETTQTAQGRRIVSWVEDVSVYTLIYNLVLPTKLFNFWDIVESFIGSGIVVADQVGWQYSIAIYAPNWFVENFERLNIWGIVVHIVESFIGSGNVVTDRVRLGDLGSLSFLCRLVWSRGTMMHVKHQI